MARAFEIEQDAVVDATPEQVWDAVATGPGMDSWFLGQTEIEPGSEGTVRFTIAGHTETSSVAAWEPPTHLVTQGAEGPDGSFHRFEYRIDRREGGKTGIRWIHSGMLGEDWRREYEGLSEGDPMYFGKLVEYVTHFPGRYATPVSAFGPNVRAGKAEVMARFRAGLGLGEDVAEGDRVRLTLEGLDPIDGVVDHLSPSFIGVRSDDAMYRFIRGYEGTVLIGHQIFVDDLDRERAERDWGEWLTRLFPS